jgi:hypothetical protein
LLPEIVPPLTLPFMLLFVTMLSLVTVNALLIVLEFIFTAFSLVIGVVSMAFSIMHPDCACSFQAVILGVKVTEPPLNIIGLSQVPLATKVPLTIM